MVKHFRAATLPLLAPVVAAVLILTGCGAGSSTAGGPLQPSDSWPVHNYEGAARAGAFAAVAVDATEREVDPLTQRLHLDVRMEDGGTLVRVLGRGLDGLDRAYLHLRYDATALHPELTRSGEWLPADTLFLGIANQPGLVVLGLTTTGGRRVIGDDVELAAVRFQPGGWDSQRRLSAVTPSQVTDLHFDTANPKLLIWSYTCKGDYDQNSEVNIADLQPIGVSFRKTEGAAGWQAAQCADGDGNGEVNASDLTAIGQNYKNMVTAYQVKGGSSPAGPFVNDQLVSYDAVQFPVPPGGGYRQFNYVVNDAVDGNYYCVAAVSGLTESSTISNVVQYSPGGGNNAPQNLAAAQAGIAVQLTWQVPAGAQTPDGYNCYVATDALMATAAKMNNGNGDVTALSYTCPLVVDPSATWYFGVKAVYDGTESGYSNIYGYNTGAPGGPTNLTATKPGAVIHLAWDAMTGVDGYNAYVSDDPGMAGAALLNTGLIATNSFDCPGSVDPGVAHYFAVKASTGGSETPQSNIAQYSPPTGDTTPPVWQQGTGVKAATPDAAGGMVLVSWYVATDAQTPPVSYMLYVEPEGTPIDWNQPAEVFASTILQTPVTTTRDGTPLVDGQRYQFAVRAADATNANPLQANVTQNTNVLFARPGIAPTSGFIGNLRTNDLASVQMPGEEVPRIVGVNRSSNLYYVTWDLSQTPPVWNIVDLDQTIGVGGRKYHPQLIGIGDDIHLLFATADTVYEAYGHKDDPTNWQLKVVTTGIAALPGVTGSGLSYSPSRGYLACVFSGNPGSGEGVYYSDRDLTGEWTPNIQVIPGDPEVWQCDMCINEATGEQWAVAANGYVSDTPGQQDELKFWYTKRADRAAGWDVASYSGYGSDVLSIEIDPATSQPLVVNAEVVYIHDDLFGDAPVSNATVFTWTGNAWARNQLEAGLVNNNMTEYVLTETLAGQDPQLIFSPSGRAVALWSTLTLEVDYSSFVEPFPGTMHGLWQNSNRPASQWSPVSTAKTCMASSNTVTASDSFQQLVTCDITDTFLEDEDYKNLVDLFDDRNDYLEGDLYYTFKPWS